MTNKYKSVVTNILYIAIGTLGSKLIYVLMLPLYTRWLATYEFGAADTITTYTDVFITIIFLNISDAIFVYPKTAPLHKKAEYFSSGLFFMLCMSIVAVILLSSTYLLEDVINKENVFFKYKWIILLLMISRYCQYYTQSFVRSLDLLGLYSFVGVLLTFLIALFSFILIPFYHFYGYVLAIILAQLFTAFYTSWKAKLYKYFFFYAIRKEPLIELLRYSIPLAPNSIMWWLISGLNRPVMEAKLGLAAVGIYAVASKISGVVNTVSSVVNLAWCNSVLDEYGKEGFEQFYNNYLRVMASIYFFCCFFLIIFSKLIVSIFLTAEYFDSVRYIPLLSIGLVCSGLGSTVGTIYAAVKQSKYFFYSSLWGGAISLLTIYPCISYWGLMGVCISLFLSFVTVFLSRWIYARKIIVLSNTLFYVSICLALLLISYVDANLDGCVKYLIELIVFLIFLYIEKDDFAKIFSNIINYKRRL